MSDRSYFSRQLVLSPDGGLGQIPNRVVVNPNSASLDTVRQTLSDFDADIVRMFIRFRSETIASGLGYVKRYYRHPMFEMIYRYNNGQERIDLNMVPVGGAERYEQYPDPNLDGGILFDLYPSADIVEFGQLREGVFYVLDSGEVNGFYRRFGAWWVYWVPVGAFWVQGPYFEPYIYYGTEEAVQAMIESSYEAPSITFLPPQYYAQYTKVYDFQRYFEYVTLTTANAAEMQLVEVLQRDPTDASLILVERPINPGTLLQLTAEQMGFSLAAVGNSAYTPPPFVPPEGFEPYVAPIGAGGYQRIISGYPATVTVTVSAVGDGDEPDRELTSFQLTVNEDQSRDALFLKLGTTAMRAVDELLDLPDSTGANVVIAPPPPLPRIGNPVYANFEHSDDPSTYELKEYYSGVPLRKAEVERQAVPSWKISVVGLAPPAGYAALDITGEFYALNVTRDVVQSWTQVARVGETIVTNDYPVMVMPEDTLTIGQSPGYVLLDGAIVDIPPGPFASNYTLTFRLDDVAIPEDAESWGPGYITMAQE